MRWKSHKAEGGVEWRERDEEKEGHDEAHGMGIAIWAEPPAFGFLRKWP